jgi:hypothetical protein
MREQPTQTALPNQELPLMTARMKYRRWLPEISIGAVVSLRCNTR